MIVRNLICRHYFPSGRLERPRRVRKEDRGSHRAAPVVAAGSERFRRGGGASLGPLAGHVAVDNQPVHVSARGESARVESPRGALRAEVDNRGRSETA